MAEALWRNPLHLVLGDSAAGCLRAACAHASPGLPGIVFGIPDDLSHGPLGDGVARAEYHRACYHGYSAWPFERIDAFAPWRELDERLDRDRPDAVVIWAGENVSEATFLAMSCHRLAERSEPLVLVTVPGKLGRNYVAVHAPEELAGFYRFHRTLGDDERITLAHDFVRIRDHAGLLRRWQEGRVIGVPVDFYDSLLMEACGAGWTVAARVVGTAMGHCDGANSLSDLFFSARLQALIASGQIEADGPHAVLREYAVRLAAR